MLWSSLLFVFVLWVMLIEETACFPSFHDLLSLPSFRDASCNVFVDFIELNRSSTHTLHEAISQLTTTATDDHKGNNNNNDSNNNNNGKADGNGHSSNNFRARPGDGGGGERPSLYDQLAPLGSFVQGTDATSPLVSACRHFAFFEDEKEEILEMLAGCQLISSGESGRPHSSNSNSNGNNEGEGARDAFVSAHGDLHFFSLDVESLVPSGGEVKVPMVFTDLFDSPLEKVAMAPTTSSASLRNTLRRASETGNSKTASTDEWMLRQHALWETSIQLPHVVGNVTRASSLSGRASGMVWVGGGDDGLAALRDKSYTSGNQADSDDSSACIMFTPLFVSSAFLWTYSVPPSTLYDLLGSGNHGDSVNNNDNKYNTANVHEPLKRSLHPGVPANSPLMYNSHAGASRQANNINGLKRSRREGEIAAPIVVVEHSRVAEVMAMSTSSAEEYSDHDNNGSNNRNKNQNKNKEGGDGDEHSGHGEDVSEGVRSVHMHLLHACSTQRARHFKDSLMQGGEWSESRAISIANFQKACIHLLRDVSRVLDTLMIPFWISSGTLLGYYRQCDFIDYSNDVDIGMFIEDYNPGIIKALGSVGLRLSHRFGTVEDGFELSFTMDINAAALGLNLHSGAGVRVPTELKVDVFFFYREFPATGRSDSGSAGVVAGVDMGKPYVWNGGTQARTGNKYKYVFPPFTLCWTRFLTLLVRIPCNTEAYLRANYGDQWMVPVTAWDWKSSPPNVMPNGQWPSNTWAHTVQCDVCEHKVQPLDEM